MNNLSECANSGVMAMSSSISIPRDRLNQVIVDHFETPTMLLERWKFGSQAHTDFDVIDNARLQRLTAAIIGEEWQEQYCMMMFSKRGRKGRPG